MKFSTKQIAIAAMIAAIYATVTITFSFMSYGGVQYRLAEALTVLPVYSPVYIVGLFIGCILGNLSSTLGPIDIVVGSLTTLAAATATYYIGKSNIKHKIFLIPLPPVILNAVVVGIELNVLIEYPLALGMTQVAWGEIVCAYVLGIMFLKFIEKNKFLKQFLLNK
jgi:uncharacterized membrane protein